MTLKANEPPRPANWRDYVEVSSQDLLSRLEATDCPVDKRYGPNITGPRLIHTKAPLWAIAIMCSRLDETEAHEAVRHCLTSAEALAAVITLFAVLDEGYEGRWNPREAAAAVREVLPLGMRLDGTAW